VHLVGTSMLEHKLHYVHKCLDEDFAGNSTNASHIQADLSPIFFFVGLVTLTGILRVFFI